VRKQVAEYQRFAGRRANLLTRPERDHPFDDPRQRERKDPQHPPVARVEHGGEYALMVSNRGAVSPGLVLQAVAHPDAVAIQECAERFDVVVRQVDGDKGATWWWSCTRCQSAVR
jgi:hypothetical protein